MKQPIPVDVEIQLLDWLRALARRKKLVLGLPILFASFAALVVYTMPDVYKATTIIFPRQPSQTGAAAMINQLSGFAGSPEGALSIRVPIDPNTKVPTEIFVSMLTSQTIVDNLIQQFELKKAYGTETGESARETLRRKTTIKPEGGGIIIISVEDKNQKRAAQIANAYVDELSKLTKTLALNEFSLRRLYLERQLQFSKTKLSVAETELKKVPDGQRFAKADDRIRKNVEKISRLRARMSAEEVHLSTMQAFLTPESPEYGRIREDLATMRLELVRLGTDDNGIQVSGGREEGGYIKAVYDASYYKALSTELEKQYEQALFDETHGASIVQVLDKAVEPELPIKPRRTIIIGGVAMLAVFIAAFWILITDVIQVGISMRKVVS